MVSMEVHTYTTINLIREENLVLDWKPEQSSCPGNLALQITWICRLHCSPFLIKVCTPQCILMGSATLQVWLKRGLTISIMKLSNLRSKSILVILLI